MFNFVENPHSSDLASDEFDDMEEFRSLEEGQVLDLCLTLEDGELLPDPDDPTPQDRMHADLSPLTFYREPLLRVFTSSQFSVDPSFVEAWLNDDEFLWKWWGLRVSGVEAHGLEKYFHARVGLCPGLVDVSVRELFSAVVDKDPPATTDDCDISPGYELAAGEPLGFLRSPSRVIEIVPFEPRSYLVTVTEGSVRPWKVLIEDPLVLLQIKREGWHLESDGLVRNLIRKGLRFKVLYPACQDGTVFYANPGPIVHPAGKSPTHADYLSYCLEVAEFFKFNPHAHVAALCAGGILWRIAVDVLPLPAEKDVVRSFHPLGCDLTTVYGKRYWSPKLTEEEVETIVGVYKWPGESIESTAARLA